MLTKYGATIETAVCRHCRGDIYRYTDPSVAPQRLWYHVDSSSANCAQPMMAEPLRESHDTTGRTPD